MYIITTQSSAYAWSTDGVTWNVGDWAGGPRHPEIVFHKGKFYATSDGSSTSFTVINPSA